MKGNMSSKICKVLTSILIFSMLATVSFGAPGGTGTSNVNIVNTPNVSVVNVPNVGISGTPSVNIANTPNVGIIGTVRDFGQPFVEGCNGNNCGFSIGDPNTQTPVLAMEYISMKAVVPSTEKFVMLEVDVQIPNAPGSRPDQYFFVPTLAGTLPNGDNVYVGNQQIRIYDYGARSVFFHGTSGVWNVTVSGSLFNN